MKKQTKKKPFATNESGRLDRKSKRRWTLDTGVEAWQSFSHFATQLNSAGALATLFARAQKVRKFLENGVVLGWQRESSPFLSSSNAFYEAVVGPCSRSCLGNNEIRKLHHILWDPKGLTLPWERFLQFVPWVFEMNLCFELQTK